MSRTYHIPSRLHPSYSLVGRWLHRKLPDQRQAGNLVVALVTLLITVLIMLNFMAWGIFQQYIEADASGTAGLLFWLGQMGVLLVFFGLVVYGRQPAITVETSETGIHIEQGETAFEAPWQAIRHLTILPSLVFHRHYRRYTGTQCFVNQIEEEMVVLETAAATVVLGLSAQDRLSFLTDASEHQPVTIPQPEVSVL